MSFEALEIFSSKLLLERLIESKPARNFPAKESKVDTLIFEMSFSSNKYFLILSRISYTAVLVKLITTISCGRQKPEFINWAIRLQATAVLPVPGPASTTKWAEPTESMTRSCSSDHSISDTVTFFLYFNWLTISRINGFVTVSKDFFWESEAF